MSSFLRSQSVFESQLIYSGLDIFCWQLWCPAPCLFLPCYRPDHDVCESDRNCDWISHVELLREILKVFALLSHQHYGFSFRIIGHILDDFTCCSPATDSMANGARMVLLWRDSGAGGLDDDVDLDQAVELYKEIAQLLKDHVQLQSVLIYLQSLQTPLCVWLIVWLIT